VGKVADFGNYLRANMRGRFARSAGEQHAELDLRGGADADEEDTPTGFERVDSRRSVPRAPGRGGRA
jgi:hypothetical protein